MKANEERHPATTPGNGQGGEQSESYPVYDDFAWFYNQYWGASFTEDARAGFQALFLPHLPVGGHILDLCCGTGQLARWLTACGFRVTGIDGSQQMIHHARQNAPQAEFIVADARSFQTQTQFDAVVSTFDSLNHLPTQADLARVFANVRRALKPDGLFFFDMNLEEGFLYSTDETYVVVRADHVCVAESTYDAKNGSGTTQVTLFRPNGREWVRSDLEIVEFCYTESEILSALGDTGFTTIAPYNAEEDLGMPRGTGRRFFLASSKGQPALGS